MKKIVLSGVIASLIACLGCGGGNDEASVALSSPCDPNPVSVGESVSCLVDKTPDSLADCTFFIEKKSGGSRIPVEAVVSFDGEQTSVDFLMPFTSAGEVTLAVGCGEEFQTLAGLQVVAIAPSADEEDSAVAPTTPGTVPTGNAGEEVLPSGPAAEPAIETPTPPSVPTTPGTPTVPFQVALEGSLLPSPARPGSAHLSARITGGGALREAYLYGVFDATGLCDHVLAIDPSGNSLNPGSRNYETYRGFIGEKCVEAENNCEGFTETNADGTPAPVNCRIDLNLNLDVTDFYFRLSQLESRAHLVARSEDGTLRTDAVVLGSPRSSLNNSRIVISETQPEFTVTFSLLWQRGHEPHGHGMPRTGLKRERQLGLGGYFSAVRVRKRRDRLALSTWHRSGERGARGLQDRVW